MRTPPGKGRRCAINLGSRTVPNTSEVQGPAPRAYPINHRSRIVVAAATDPRDATRLRARLTFETRNPGDEDFLPRSGLFVPRRLVRVVAFSLLSVAAELDRHRRRA
jgi:hypothetical protein